METLMMILVFCEEAFSLKSLITSYWSEASIRSVLKSVWGICSL